MEGGTRRMNYWLLLRGSAIRGLPSLKQSLTGMAKEKLVSRPEHKVFGLAMLARRMVLEAAHPYRNKPSQNFPAQCFSHQQKGPVYELKQ